MATSEQRKLVTLRQITNVRRLQGRYRPYDVVTVGDGWNVVVYHDDFSVGETVVYFEIDSFIPATGGRFTWQQDNKMGEFRGEKGYHVRSQMLGKQISQGLVQNINAIPAIKTLVERLTMDFDGDRGKALAIVQEKRLDEIVGVKKWEVSFESQGRVLGRVPMFFPRPACDRVQNCSGLFNSAKYRNTVFQVTEKVDGVSMTVYRVEVGSRWHQSLPPLPHGNSQENCKDARVGVASAGEDLDMCGNDTYWQAARHADIVDRIHHIGLPNIAVQGELVGPSIKKNSLKFADDAPHEFIVFQIFDIDKQSYMNPAKVIDICKGLDLPHVPILGYYRLRDFAVDLQDLLIKADGVGSRGQTREGFVLKSMTDEFAFKVISNKWLLEQGE